MRSPNLISPNIQSSRLAWGDSMRAPHQSAGDQRGTDFLHTEFYLTQASLIKSYPTSEGSGAGGGLYR